jgi:saccharopine dehydrogenase-like NADP-dependent oxidoreductase
MKAILVAGGYGVVGRRIAADLAIDYPVVIAGRHFDRGEAIAKQLGRGIRAQLLDVTDPDSVAAAVRASSLVVSCIDQPGRRLLNAAIDFGVMYTDITPHLTELGRGWRYEQLRQQAIGRGARVVLGTGIVPGISNVIARALADGLGGADRIVTSLLLSVHDESGPASLEYFAKELAMPFSRHVDGRDVAAWPFTEPVSIAFPQPFGERRAYLFPFSDQVLYPVTLAARSVETRLALDPPGMDRLLAFISRSGALRLLDLRRMREALVRYGRRGQPTSPHRFALRVDLSSRRGSACGTLVGSSQADAAAAGASCTARALISGEVSSAGVWMPEEVMSPSTFFARLTARGLNVDLVAGSVSPY